MFVKIMNKQIIDQKEIFTYLHITYYISDRLVNASIQSTLKTQQ